MTTTAADAKIPAPHPNMLGAEDPIANLDRDEPEAKPTAVRSIVDGNTAAADVAFRVNELCSIYPITPSSPMAELADEWSAFDRENIWGQVPSVIEMQSEGGAAGAMHGALQAGALSTTFTASQGLLLMIPNMFKIAGELTSTVMHVAARSLATQGLSIFGDHQDVMAARQTGWAMLASASVQECHDNALIAQNATLHSRVPFMHFFDGFRTSHELNTCLMLSDDDLRSMIPDELVREHRRRALSPEHPFIRGTAQNPDVYFQGRESANPFYLATPGLVQQAMDDFAKLTGRQYHLVDYVGAPDADRVAVIMGSGAEVVQQAVSYLNAAGQKTGVLIVRLYRPFPADEVLAAIPETVKKIAVLDRTKEPGSNGEPLYLDVTATFAEAVSLGNRASLPRIIGGRYGLSSKDFTPAMAAAIFDELAKDKPRPRFTVGINDDVTRLSLDYDPQIDLEDPLTKRAVFYGMGSDGTVGANKNTIKILGSDEDTYAQGYFVYDSKKSGSRTTSHLRFGPDPIKAPYLVNKASFIGCHHWSILERIDVLEFARKAIYNQDGERISGTTLLINSPFEADQVWDHLPAPMQAKIIDYDIALYAINANEVARTAGLGGRTNTVLQTCYFAISGVLPSDVAIERIKHSITKTYSRKSMEIVRKNHVAVDEAVAHLHKIEVPREVTSDHGYLAPVPASAPDFVQDVTATMLIDKGDTLPVSKLPVDGSFPSGTTKYEKRNISDIIAVWDPETCIQCGNCSFVCPHAVLRAKHYPTASLAGAPAGFDSAPLDAAGLPDSRYTLQVYAEDCTGCGLCVEACPVSPIGQPQRKAINLAPMLERSKQRQNVEFFESIPRPRRSKVNYSSVRGVQFLTPLFEFSGACSGCGETPYLKLLTQLFGDRLQIANATGCSSIYGGNLPTTPWAKNDEGRGGPGQAAAGAAARRDRRRRPGGRIAERPPGDDARAADSVPPDAGSLRQARSAVRAAGRRSAFGRRSPDAPLGVDHRWRRLGLRHRFGGSGSCAGVRTKREHLGDGYRGVFEHRWPGVQVDPAGCGRQVRHRRQDDQQEGSRDASRRLRSRLRGPGEPDHRLQPLHQPRHRHAQGPGAAVQGGGLRSLAADAVQPGAARRRPEPVPARLATSADLLEGVPHR